MNTEHPNYYSIIPANVRYDNRLTDSAKLMYGEISSLVNKFGYCYASNTYFMKLYNSSKSKIQRIIKSLENCGHIKCTFVYGENTKDIKQRRIYLTQSINIVDNPVDNSVDNSKGGIKNDTRGGIKNDTHNNINIINIKEEDNNIARAREKHVEYEKPTRKQVLKFWIDETEHYSDILSLLATYEYNNWQDMNGKDIKYWKLVIKRAEKEAKENYDKKSKSKAPDEIYLDCYYRNIFIDNIKKQLSQENMCFERIDSIIKLKESENGE